MLNTLKTRLAGVMEIKKVKEKTSKYEITFIVYGKEYKNELPKTCAPGCQCQVADATICVVMAMAEMDKGDMQAAKMWLDKSSSGGDEE